MADDHTQEALDEIARRRKVDGAAWREALRTLIEAKRRRLDELEQQIRDVNRRTPGAEDEYRRVFDDIDNVRVVVKTAAGWREVPRHISSGVAVMASLAFTRMTLEDE